MSSSAICCAYVVGSDGAGANWARSEFAADRAFAFVN